MVFIRYLVYVYCKKERVAAKVTLYLLHLDLIENWVYFMLEH